MSWTRENDPTNPNATPVFDGWGWAEYWSANDWLTWHRAMKSALGLDIANARFLTEWNKQGFAAAPLNARTFDAAFREYARANGFLSGLYGNAQWASPVLNTYGSANEAVDAVSETVGGAAATIRTIGPILLTVGVVALAYLYFNKAARLAK